MNSLPVIRSLAIVLGLVVFSPFAALVPALVPVFVPALAEEGSSPRVEMEATLERLVTVVEKNPGDSQKEFRLDQMREIIEPKFDFEEMAKRSLGVKWKGISTDERTEFVDLFSELLARTYLGRLDNVERNMVSVKDEKVKFPRALVKTTVDYKGDLFPIDYKLINRGGVWRVYDVIIENIGLVANYRSEFAGIIRKSKFSGLLDKLRKKNSDPAES